MLGLIKNLIAGKGGQMLQDINEFHAALADHLSWLDARSNNGDPLCPEEITILEAGKRYALVIGGMVVGDDPKKELEDVTADVGDPESDSEAPG